MRTITEDELKNEYSIYKNLTPEKEYKTYLALKERSCGGIFPVILKEMDEKRSSIYNVLACLWNPFVASTYDVIEIKNYSDQKPIKYIAVTEYVYAYGCADEESMSLSRFVLKNGPLKEKTALYICMQLCDGLKEFHEKGFVHRDIKPDNIMIYRYDTEWPEIKIVDFGGSKQVNQDSISDTTIIGTLGYQAPESISSLTTDKADIYSIGCVLNFMLTGQDPGISCYKGNHYIVSIIENATNDDPYSRYKSVTAMQKQVKHQFGVRAIDRIPFLREIPGFRTNTLWKKIFAIIVYYFMILFVSMQLDENGFLSMIIYLLFYLVIPLIMGFNMGNLLRFFPDRIRKNTSLFITIRAVTLFICIFIPVILTM